MQQLIQFTILTLCITFIHSIPLVREGEDSPAYWNELAKNDILKIKSRQYLNHRAKNAILFIGDGMGISTITASRIRKAQLNGQPGEESYLFFEKNFPDNGLMKTYNVNKQTPDSAGTATAYLTGVKANFETIGVGPKVNAAETDCQKIQENKVNSFLEEARKEGKSIGIVTTARITHASPAAGYAHVAHRNHESDVDLPQVTKDAGCKDIARQLVEDFPGKALNVAFGGGRKYFLPREVGGRRTDSLNLIEKWNQLKNESGLAPEKYKYITTVKELQELDTENVQNVLGLFAEDHLSHHDLHEKTPDQPTLTQMTEAAIKILSKNEKGFLLFVEAGLVDLANHANNAKQALDDAGELDRAVEKASSMLNKNDTLIAVSADHSHGLTISGYPDRGNDILGVTGYVERETNKSFTTLMYATGPGHQRVRLDAAKLTNLTDDNFKQHSTVELDDANHTGEEVVLYANGGPFSHFYNGIHEQNYVAHLISYATCIGQYKNEDHCK